MRPYSQPRLSFNFDLVASVNEIVRSRDSLCLFVQTIFWHGRFYKSGIFYFSI